MTTFELIMDGDKAEFRLIDADASFAEGVREMDALIEILRNEGITVEIKSQYDTHADPGHTVAVKAGDVSRIHVHS